jgi:iron complex outermembrane receptor protein
LSGTSESGQHAYRFSGYGFDQSNGWAKHSDADKQAFTFRHDMDLGANRVLKTILTHTDLYSQMGGAVTQANWDRGAIGESPQTFTFRDVTATRLSSSLEAEFNPGGLTTLTGFYRKNETNQVPSFLLRPGAGTGTGTTLDQAFETLGVDVRHRQMIGSQGSKVVLGFVYDQGEMSGNEQSFNYTISGGRNIDKRGNTSVQRDYTTDFYNAGVYSQAEIVLKPGLIAVAGARYDTIEYDYTRLPGQGTQGVPSGKTTYSGFSPKLGVVFSPNTATSYYANVSTGFAPPEITTRYGGRTLGTIEETTTTSKELGVRSQLWNGRLAVDLAVYEMDMKNAVYSSDGLDNTANFNAPVNYNANSRFRGVEFGLEYKVNKRLDVATSWAFTQHTMMSAPRNFGTSTVINNTGKRLRYSPDQIGNIQAKYRIAEKTIATIEAQYVSSYWMNEANTVKYKGHTLLHTRFTHHTGPWEYWLAIRNLTDKKYAEWASWSAGASGSSYNPGAPRTVQAGLRYTFGGKAK